MTSPTPRTAFRTSRLLDFMSEKELTAQTGHRRDAWPLVALKELVDNSIDACEDEGISPEVTVTVEKDGITVTDNGPGIPAETVKGVLDFSVRISTRDAYVSPTRGAQGNALKTIVAMPFVLSGERGRGRIEISARGIRHEISLEVDRIRQEPKVSHEEHRDRLVKKGTSIRVDWPVSAPLKPGRCEGSFFTNRRGLRLAEPSSHPFGRVAQGGAHRVPGNRPGMEEVAPPRPLLLALVQGGQPRAADLRLHLP